MTNFQGKISDSPSSFSAPAVVEDEHLPLCHFPSTDWYVYIGSTNRESCGTRSHTQSSSICPTQLTSFHLPTPHTFPQQAGTKTPSHVGFHIPFKHAAGTHWHMCARCEHVWLSHTNSQKFVCGATCAAQCLWSLVTAVLIRLTTREMVDVAVLQNKQPTV